MTAIRKHIIENIKIYISTQGYTLSPKSKSYHSLVSFVFTYINLGGMNDNIKIEINYSLRTHIFETTYREISIQGIADNTLISTLNPLELFAAKINALLSRSAARDLYDIHNMINFGLFHENELSVLRKCVVFYTAISQDEIPDKYDFSCLNTITLRKIKTDLLPVIQKGEHFGLEEVKEKVGDFLKKLLILSPDEQLFLSEFKENRYRPELLFDDKDILERLNTHPMALWKIMNK